jgi:hypothetical protein
MAIGHGKKAYLALDDLGGALTSVKGSGDTISFSISADQPDTPVYGDRSATRELLGQRRATLSFAGYVKGVLAGSTAKVHGKATRVLLNEFAVSGEIQTGTVSRTAPVVNSECYGDDWDERDLKGVFDGSITFSGPYNGATGKIDAILQAIQASETRGILSYAPTGFAVGNLVDMGSLAITERPINSPISDKSMVSVTAPVNGEVDLGVSLHDLTAETTTFDGTTVDETAATANGGVAHLHCTAFSGTNGTWKVQDSADASSWADIITFASVTAVGSQRIELAAGTAVRRYVRVICSTDNFTSATVAVIFARRDFVYGTAGTHRHFVGMIHKEEGSFSFSYGPVGNAVSSPNFTGEVTCTSYVVTYSHNAPSKFTAEFLTTGAVSAGTY